jgi:hypothetical protein
MKYTEINDIFHVFNYFKISSGTWTEIDIHREYFNQKHEQKIYFVVFLLELIEFHYNC